MYSIFNFLYQYFKHKRIDYQSFIISIVFMFFVLYLFIIQEYGVLVLYNEYVPIYELNIYLTVLIVGIIYNYELKLAKNFDKSNNINNFVRLISIYYLALLVYNTGYYFTIFEPIYVCLIYPISIMFCNNFNKMGNILLFSVIVLFVTCITILLLVFDIHTLESIPPAVSFHYCGPMFYFIFNTFFLTYYTNMSMDETLKE